MKVIGINGSPHKKGNTVAMIEAAFSEIEKEGIECKLFQLGGKPVSGCIDCGYCKQNNNNACSITNDRINSCIKEMMEADAIIIGSPTYFSSLTTETKALIDRAGRVCRTQELLKRKIGAAVSPARRAGSMSVFNSINNFFLVQEMIIAGSNYWNVGLARAPGDFEKDDEGQATMKILGTNIAWLLKKLK